MEYSYKFRLYPNKAQEQQIQRTFGCVRFVYNHFLDRRIKEYENNGVTLNYVACCRELTILKHEIDWLKEVDSTALQRSLRSLDDSYKNFFRRVKEGGQAPGFPKFRSKRAGRKSYTSNSPCIHVFDHSIQLPKLGQVKCRISRPVQGRVLSATVSQTANGKYYVSLCCTEVEIPQMHSTGAVVGIDLGLRYLVYTSDGDKMECPKELDKQLKTLARTQRALSRKPIGSANREKARLKVAKIHERITNCRTDYIQKLTTDLVRQYDVICAENLSVRQMQKSNKWLARQISDAGWSGLLRMLQYKCAWQHKQFIQVDQFYPSTQLCSVCGHQNTRLKERYQVTWECPKCGAIHDIDFNAAQNILNKGLLSLA